MASINIDPDYFGHPKTVRLIGILGDGADIYPVRLWCYTAKFHKMDGLLKVYSDKALEDVMDWRGERGKCINAMVEVGFLDVIDAGYAVHEWADHAAHIIAYQIKSRKMTKRRLEKIKHEDVDNILSTDQLRPDESSSSNTTSESSSNLSRTHHVLPMQGKAAQDNVFQSNALHGINGADFNHSVISDDAFVLRLSEEEYSHWCSKIQSLINRENEARINNKFIWSSEGTIPKDEWRFLFNRFGDDDKKRLLREACNILDGKLIWANYIELAIMISVRLSAKKRIHKPIAFVFDMLKKPGGIVSDCTDGVLKGYKIM